MSGEGSPPRSFPAPGACPSVLVVDDENGVRDLMRRWLQAGGYSVVSARDADEALGLMQTSPPAVALCDIRMPGRDGLWLADRIRQDFPETAVIMATGMQDAGAAVATLRHGTIDCLTKPFGRDRLRDAVGRGVEWHRTAKDSRCWREKLEDEVRFRHARLSEAVAGLHAAPEGAVDGLLSILSGGEPGACEHARRVAALAHGVAQAWGMSQEEISTVHLGALLHDFGKLAMPDAVMRKPAPLTAEEQEIVRRHPEIGAELIGGLPGLADAALVVRSLHERPDGLGYPGGVGGERLSPSARIVSAVDAYDTMTHPRVFRGAVAGGDALIELERWSGTQFDPRVVRLLGELLAGPAPSSRVAGACDACD